MRAATTSVSVRSVGTSSPLPAAASASYGYCATTRLSTAGAWSATNRRGSATSSAARRASMTAHDTMPLTRSGLPLASAVLTFWMSSDWMAVEMRRPSTHTQLRK